MSSYMLPCPNCGRMFADHRPRQGYDDEDDGGGPGRLCPACAARRVAFGNGLAVLIVLAIAAAAFTAAYQFM
jgi:hypothetical protein